MFHWFDDHFYYHSKIPFLAEKLESTRFLGNFRFFLSTISMGKSSRLLSFHFFSFSFGSRLHQKLVLGRRKTRLTVKTGRTYDVYPETEIFGMKNMVWIRVKALSVMMNSLGSKFLPIGR